MIEAAALLAVTRVAVHAIPFRWIVRALGATHNASPPPLSPAHTVVARRIGATVRHAARRVPFSAVCLPQALTAKVMLARRGISSTLFLGVRRAADQTLQAHAWLRAGEAIVTGGSEQSEFSPVGEFT